MMRVLEAPIQTVTIYDDRARITRRGQVFLEPGEHTIVLADLPMTVDNNSVRTAATNPAVKILDVEVKITTPTVVEPPELAALQAKYDSLHDADDALRDDDRIESERLAFLKDIRQAASKGLGDALAHGQIPLENIEQLMNYVLDQQRQSQSRRRQIAQERRQLEKQIREVEQDTPPGSKLKRRSAGGAPSANTLLRASRNKKESDQKKSDSSRGPFRRRATANDENPPRRSPFGRRQNDNSDKDKKRPSRFERAVSKDRLEPPPNDGRRKSIEILVRCEQETDFDLSISYTVSHAHWEPFYDIRVMDGEFSVAMLAQIRQQSGEDWPAVPIRLSTARPTNNASMPRLRPWLIDAENPPKRPEPRRPQFGRSSRFGERDSNRRPLGGSPFGRRSDKQKKDQPLPSFLQRSKDAKQASNTEANGTRTISMELESSEINGTTPVISYELQKPLAVPSNNRACKADIMTLDMEGELEYIAIPSQEEQVYLCARIRNTSDITLLPGSALIFYDSHYIGKMELKTVAPKDNIMVQVGEQEQLRLTRQLEEHSGTRPTTERLRRTEFIYRMTLVSELDEPVAVTLYDHLPVARHKDIKVMVRAVSPQPIEQTDMNIFRWRIELEPGQRQEVVLGFALEHPHDMKIVSKRT